jgi:hypothetical protein
MVQVALRNIGLTRALAVDQAEGWSGGEGGAVGSFSEERNRRHALHCLL